MTQINIRIEDDVKTDSEALFKRLGLSMSAAISLFLHQAINHQGLPFEVRDRGVNRLGISTERSFATNCEKRAGMPERTRCV